MSATCPNTLPIVLLKESLYCPRLPYLKLNTVWEPPTPSMNYPTYTKTMLASILRSQGYTGDLVMELPVKSHKLGLHGKIDAAIITKHEAIPVEVKLYSPKRKLYTRNHHHLIQLAAYAICLEETIGKPVKKAVLISLEPQRITEVAITPRLREETYHAAVMLHHYLQQSRLPPRTPKRARCKHCFYNKTCPP